MTIPNKGVKGQKLPAIQTETTGVLVAPLNSKPKTHRFVRTNEADKRIYRVPVSVTKEMHEFLKEYSQVIGCSMTEILLRGLECTTGYNGRNGKRIIKNMRAYISQSQDMENTFNYLKKMR